MAEKNITVKMKSCYSVSAKKLCLTKKRGEKKGYISFCEPTALKDMPDVTSIYLVLE